MKKRTLSSVLGVFTLLFTSVYQPLMASEVDDRRAMEIFKSMAKTLAEAQQFSVNLNSSFDAPQTSGQMIEFSALRHINVKRPDKLRVDLLRSDGEQRILVFDGKEIIAHNISENIYSKASKVGSVDDAVKYLVSVLNFPIPLARMFSTNFPAEIDRLVEIIDYVERNMLTDVPTDHLAARTKDVDFQVWVSEGEQPLPERIVITYKNYRGKPQFRANFSNWNLSAKVTNDLFKYNLPENAERVPILVSNISEKGLLIPAKEGGAK